MDRLAACLALHGAVVLIISLVAGLLLHRAIRNEQSVAAWHLVHSGGSGRGVLLIALAATVHLIALPSAQLSTFVWLVLVFTWTSMSAMVIAAASGERGLRHDGSVLNRLVYVLYFLSAVAVFPANVLLVVGLVRAL
jgi:hypothetical protein